MSDDQTLFKHCEATIEQGIRHFLATGQALQTIRSKRLYKLAGFSTFEQYCNERWNITRQHASNLIAAFAAEEELSTVVSKPVLENENQARQYRQLDQEQKQDLHEAVRSGADIGEALGLAGKRSPVSGSAVLDSQNRCPHPMKSHRMRSPA